MSNDDLNGDARLERSVEQHYKESRAENLTDKEVAEYWLEYVGDEPRDIKESDFWSWLEEKLEEEANAGPEHDD